jgi:hypothetical protein
MEPHRTFQTSCLRAGTDCALRSQLAGRDLGPIVEYVVVKPLAVATESVVAPWYGQPGGGLQIDLKGSSAGDTIRLLARDGFLKEVTR